MKLSTILRSIALTSLLGVAVVSQAATFNAESSRDHGAWASLKLSLGDQRFYRAINSGEYTDLRVMVDFDSAQCEPELEVHFEGGKSFESTETLGVTAVSIRVDRKPIHEAIMEASSVAGERTMYAYVLVGEKQRLISEMRSGNTLRFKFYPFNEGSDPFYAEFSLRGSRAALDRAASLCKEEQSGPEDYFRDNDQPDDEAKDYF